MCQLSPQGPGFKAGTTHQKKTANDFGSVGDISVFCNIYTNWLYMIIPECDNEKI